jgi:putative ABC transport system permease protein
MILQEILTESSLISIAGGIIGILLGVIGSYVLRLYTGGTIITTVTPQLAAGGLFFALCLGILGGLYPAWQATQIDPIRALRSE